MFRVMQVMLAVVTLVLLSVAAQADSITWDILNENYGNGTGQVAFNDNYGAYFGTSLPAEVRSEGKSTLTLPADAHSYPSKASIAGLGPGNLDRTIEFKLRTPSNDRVQLFISETGPGGGGYWNHALLINGLYEDSNVIPAPNAIVDYNARANDVNQAPAGFDGSAEHVYRIVRQDPGTGTRSALYLDNNPTPLLILGLGAGAMADGLNLEWGFFPVGSQPSTFEFSYLRIASGAFVPTPEPSTITLLTSGLMGLLAYAWRKRR